MLQVDSVNVLQRAHYMPLYSRMGPYDAGLLERASSGRERRRMVEYWAHVQAFMPVELWPHMRHRMERYRSEKGKWGLWDDRPDFEQEVLTAVRDRGPVTARHLDEEFSGPRTKQHWGWNWSEARRCLDYLFLVGEVAIAGRSSQFEVIYDVPERVLPTAVLAAPTPTPEDAHRELVRRAARSHGVATVKSLSDYYRMLPEARPPRRSATSSRRASWRRCGSRAGSARPSCTRDARRPAPRRTRGRCSARSTRWSGSASAPSTSSTSTTASRSTRPRRSGCTATTCCRSCSATRSSAGSTSRPTAPPGGCWCKGAYAEPHAPADTADGARRRAAPDGRLAGSRRRRGRGPRRPRSGPPGVADSAVSAVKQSARTGRLPDTELAPVFAGRPPARLCGDRDGPGRRTTRGTDRQHARAGDRLTAPRLLGALGSRPCASGCWGTSRSWWEIPLSTPRRPRRTEAAHAPGLARRRRRPARHRRAPHRPDVG